MTRGDKGNSCPAQALRSDLTFCLGPPIAKRTCKALWVRVDVEIEGEREMITLGPKDLRAKRGDVVVRGGN